MVTPVQLPKETIVPGRTTVSSAMKAVHQACPCPSMVPLPVIETFLRLLMVMKLGGLVEPPS
jgi:hypothetical protein